MGIINHIWMPLLAYDANRTDDVTKIMGIPKDYTAREEVIKNRLSLLHEKTKQHKDMKWIISSEHLQSRLTADEELLRLKRILTSLFEEIKIVIYLRKPIEGMISTWSTLVKAGGIQETLPSPNSIHSNIYKHKDTILRWRNAFPESELIPRLFQKESFVDNDLIRDFSFTSGINTGNLKLHSTQHNTAMSHHGIRLLSRINKEIPAFKENKENPVRQGLSDYIQSYFSGFPKYLPSEKELQSFEDLYADSDEWVRKEYFPNRAKLWPTPTTTINGEGSMKMQNLFNYECAVAAMISHIWKEKYDNTIQLKEMIKGLNCL